MCHPERAVFALDNQIQHYAWGSTDGLSQLLGVANPQQQPQAEIWMGAHPSAPSQVQLGAGCSASLQQLIAADPEYWLGNAQAKPHMPFLFKVISAAAPLSLQVHPSLNMAQQGFAFEEQQGISRNDGCRNYRDANHKPELVLALTPFRAMIGFRSPQQVSAQFMALALPALTPWVRRLHAAGEAAIQQLYMWMLMLPQAEASELIAAVLARIEQCDGLTAETIHALQANYPDDPCVLAPLIMQLHQLQPGEAVYLGAGLPHSYISGTALEIMANSDNVIRGGLTEKHIDHQELIYVTDFTHHSFEVLTGTPTRTPGEQVYAVPSNEFCLSLLTVSAQQVMPLSSKGLEILLCLEGEIAIRSEGCSLQLKQGDSCVIPAALTQFQLQGQGRVASASGGMGK